MTFMKMGGIMFCKSCQHSVDYLRRQTALEHLKSARHKNRKQSSVGKFNVKWYLLSVVKTLHNLS